MRYWIYWNDLVQGPFEIEELLALRAFSAELLICPEDGQDWTPAAAVPEMLPFFQPTFTRDSGAPPPPPPPPLPRLSTPHQGEFFHEASQQEHLFNSSGEDAYTFSPIQDPGVPKLPEIPSAMTTPFHFSSLPAAYAPPLAVPVSPSRDPELPSVEFEPQVGGLEPESVSIELSGPKMDSTPSVENYVIQLGPPDLNETISQPAMTPQAESSASPPAAGVPSPIIELPSPSTVNPPPVPKTVSPLSQGEKPMPPAAEPASMVEPPIVPAKKDTTTGIYKRKSPAAEPASVSFNELLAKPIYRPLRPTEKPATVPLITSIPLPVRASLPPLDVPVQHRRSLVLWIFGLFLFAGLVAAYYGYSYHVEPSAKISLPTIGSEKEIVPPSVTPAYEKIDTVLPLAVENIPPPKPPVNVSPAKKRRMRLVMNDKPRSRPRVVVPASEPTGGAPALNSVSTALPGLVPPGAMAPMDTPPPPKPATPTISPAAEPVDPWRAKEQEAIAVTLKQRIYAGKRTIGENAQMMLDQMHEKELVHAADTGERLYLPDKLAWTALQESGSRYRVYLTFMAWQSNGERIQARVDSFIVDLAKKTVTYADESTRRDFYDIKVMLQHQPNAKAGDVESILSAVDTLNRQKMRAVILKSSLKDKNEQKLMQEAARSAEAKLQRTLVYFRTKYAEKTLQNIAKAYMFESTLKGK